VLYSSGWALRSSTGRSHPAYDALQLHVVSLRVAHCTVWRLHNFSACCRMSPKMPLPAAQLEYWCALALRLHYLPAGAVPSGTSAPCQACARYLSNSYERQKGSAHSRRAQRTRTSSRMPPKMPLPAPQVANWHALALRLHYLPARAATCDCSTACQACVRYLFNSYERQKSSAHRGRAPLRGTSSRMPLKMPLPAPQVAY
jgi:hypothetical protein